MNLMIVDDDKRVVDSIVESLNWQEIGVSRTLLANNVGKAIEILQIYPIHVLLTDIEMSQGSGLELLEWIRNQKLPMKCIVLSSYAKFSYAQKAIELGVSEYLLKPVRLRELAETIRRVVSTIPAVDEDQKNDLYYKILKGHDDSAKYLKSGIEQKIIPKKTEYMRLFLFRIYPKNYNEKRVAKNYEILDFTIRNVLKEFFGERGIPLETIVQNNEIEWYAMIKEDISHKTAVYQLKDCICQNISPNVLIYVSNSFPLQNILVFKEEMEEIAEKYLPGNAGVLAVQECAESNWEGSMAPWDQWMTDACGMSDLKQLAELMKRYLEKINGEVFLPVKWLQKFRKKLVWMVYRLLEQYHMVFSHIFDNEEYDEYYDCAIYSVNHMIGFIDWLFTRMERNKGNNTRKEMIVEAVKRYIGEHLADDLSRKQIAEVMYMSEDYVGKIFIGAEGKSISTYVMEQRMELAKKDLEQTSLPVSQIAMVSGYHNFSYFSKTFRDYTGYTPNEYRARALMEKKK